MAEVDTSSYPRAQLPVSPLDTAQKLGSLQQQAQQIQSGGLTIDRQKLENANIGLTYLTRAMTSLGPDASKDQYKAVGENAVRMGLVPAQQLQVWNERVDAAPDSKSFYNEAITAAATHQEMLNYHLGQPGTMDNGQQIQPTLTSPKFGVKPIGLPVQQQLPPNTTVATPSGNQALGPQPPQVPAGALPVQGGIPGQMRPAPIQPLPTGPVTNPAINGPSNNFGGTVTGATVQPQSTPFNDRFSAIKPAGPMTSLAPGQAEAIGVPKAAGAQALVNARAQASNYQREIFPLEHAIPALEKLGTKGTGPGTETINNLKSFALSMVPGVKESDFNGTVKDYDIAKKYLTDFVNQTGNSGTNDKLAAAFAGNPSVHISNAAAVDVAKSALALRRMKQAELISFEKSGLPEEDYQKYSVRFNNEQDPRAYGIDQMSPDNLKKLITGMSKDELATFKRSVEIAHNTKSIPPIGSK